ncbi:PREDICTED: coiled-coil domain-containing protein C16orf93 homolog isoform X2 [Poecilia mexicana]|uniref:coiled-coil domain-containing protein C16orf93 homolog isoform X2 n=1 Tax=Poecilia mexicana TaxID=48701 RepID=UPI00072EA9B4|nr:PREDICTED: coiled-coil domain-containing protein C16orf93 homolog isoform X2 [Poecilia mexicana]XP_014829172.1 PREDICTED: coiled-coil domain-containing protein C16orf93 homolog isoform X2 [Poecilia mexicana]
MDTSIKVPRDLKAKLLLWTDISFHDMEVIDQIQSVPDLESALCSVLAVDLPEPKKGVLLELYVQTVLFCRQQGFSKEQTSALVSIIKSIHEANIETPLNNSEQCFKYCNDLLLCHSVRRPPFSVKLFSLDEVNCVLNYIQDHYLRHDRLYKYIFTPQVKLDLFLTYSGKGGEGLAADESAEQASVDLKALVEQEVKEQMEQVSKQLDQRIKETVFEQSSKAQSAKSGKKGKK